MQEFSHLTTLDQHHIFDTIGDQPNQLLANYVDGMRDEVVAAEGVGIEHIVVAGMGGSALAANIVRNWLYDKLKVPFEVVRGYDLPGYVNNRTLVVISSTSGNTEEALAAFEKATKLNARMLVMCSGGRLAELARARNITAMMLPAGIPQRLTVLAGVKALACLIEDMNLSAGTDLRRELIDVANWLNAEKFTLSPDNADDNPAQDLALKLVGKPVIVYGTPATGSAAYKWKININENAKQLAWYNTYPELDHNEFQGWIYPKDKNLAIVQLTSNHDNDRIAARIELSSKILGKYGFAPITVETKGTTYLQQLLYIILFGDYVSAYLGILNGIDPAPVELVEELKKDLT